MKKEKKRIKIFRSDDNIIFQKMVNLHLEHGWEIHGKSIFENSTYIQILVIDLRKYNDVRFSKNDCITYLGNCDRNNHKRKKGLSIEYYDNGNIKEYCNYNNSKLNGQYVSFYQNGECKSRQSYSEGMLIGSYKSFYENGQLFKDGYCGYENSREGSLKCYYENGEVKREGRCGGEFGTSEVGIWKYYNKKGGLDGVGKFDLGLETGEWKYYHRNGELKFIVNYINKEKSKYEKMKSHNHFIRQHLRDFKNNTDSLNKERPTHHFLNWNNNHRYLKYNPFRHGIFQVYYDNGQLKEEGQYVKGFRDGEFISYYKSGEVYERILYDNISETVEGTSFYKNGKIQSEVDRKSYQKIYYENGMLIGEGERRLNRDDCYSGIWEIFYSNGEKYCTGELNDFVRIGEWEFYYENSNLESKGRYKDISYDESGEEIYDDKDGDQIGIWKYYNEKNELVKEINFDITLNHSDDLFLEKRYKNSIDPPFFPNGLVDDDIWFLYNHNREYKTFGWGY